MSRIVAASLIGVAVAIAAVLLIGHATPEQDATPVRPLTVRASFDPPAVQFGDRIVTRVVVLADRDALDTSGLRVTQDIAPLTALGATHVTRTTRGRLLVVSYELPAVCLSDDCLARTGTKVLRLPTVRATAPRRDGGVERAHTAWPTLKVGSRVAAADVTKSPLPLRADTSLPAVTYRIAPHTLSRLLDAIAVLLVLAGVGLAVWQATVLVRRHRSSDTRSALERAVALVREAESRPPEDRRRAVGLLARVLGRRDETLAREAGDLAWSEPAPAPDELAALADQVDGT